MIEGMNQQEQEDRREAHAKSEVIANRPGKLESYAEEKRHGVPQPHLGMEVVAQAGIRDLQAFDLGDPRQQVEAQEVLERVWKKLNEAIALGGCDAFVEQLAYKDQKSGETIRAGHEGPGRMLLLNSMAAAPYQLSPQTSCTATASLSVPTFK